MTPCIKAIVVIVTFYISSLTNCFFLLVQVKKAAKRDKSGRSKSHVANPKKASYFLCYSRAIRKKAMKSDEKLEKVKNVSYKM